MEGSGWLTAGCCGDNQLTGAHFGAAMPGGRLLAVTAVPVANMAGWVFLRRLRLIHNVVSW